MVARLVTSWAVLLLIAGCGAPDGPTSGAVDSSDSLPGILTVPLVEDGTIYFAGGDSLYAFDELLNEVRWTATLDPAPSEIDVGLLPAPAPVSSGSYLLVHLGRRLWAVSRVDGRTVWSVPGLPEASWKVVRRSSDPLPGYRIHGEDAHAAVITLEEEDGSWHCRGRRLGDGGLDWETGQLGDPRGWWLERQALWLVCESFEASNIASIADPPAVLLRIDAETGETIWEAPPADDFSFRGTVRAGGRVFLLEESVRGEFQVRAVDEESGELHRSINYSAGELIALLQSDDKLAILHLEDPNADLPVEFRLYYSSLNPIRSHNIFRSRTDQLFIEPEIDRRLLLYAGAAYSLYDGNLVWQEEAQRSLVDWAADEDHIYLWDSGGYISCIEGLTGLEAWRTAFDVLPPGAMTLPNHGGASLVLTDGRLMATSPAGELFRVNPVTGELHAGVLTVHHSEGEVGVPPAGEIAGASGRDGFPVWLALLVFLAAAGIGWIVSWATSARGATDDKRAT